MSAELSKGRRLGKNDGRAPRRVYMLDTNICVYIMKNRPPEVRETFHRVIGRAEVCIAAITLAELRFGVEQSEYRMRNLNALNSFLAMVHILDFDERAAAEYGEIRADLKQRGTPIGPMDMLIAAQARAKGLTLVTNNVREFGQVPGLRLDNWVREVGWGRLQKLVLGERGVKCGRVLRLRLDNWVR